MTTDFTDSISFDTLREANLKRLPLFKDGNGNPAHDKPDGSDWSLNDWYTAFAGEVGEAGNVFKKIRRGDFTLESEKGRAKVKEELGGALIYLDLLAHRCGLSLSEIAVYCFNTKSMEQNIPVMIDGFNDEVYDPNNEGSFYNEAKGC